jgi:hypothetical protein
MAAKPNAAHAERAHHILDVSNKNIAALVTNDKDAAAIVAARGLKVV